MTEQEKFYIEIMVRQGLKAPNIHKSNKNECSGRDKNSFEDYHQNQK